MTCNILVHCEASEAVDEDCWYRYLKVISIEAATATLVVPPGPPVVLGTVAVIPLVVVDIPRGERHGSMRAQAVPFQAHDLCVNCHATLAQKCIKNF